MRFSRAEDLARRAVARLRAARDAGFFKTPGNQGLLESPHLDALRQRPDFQALRMQGRGGPM